jgi:hypothetical protein
MIPTVAPILRDRKISLVLLLIASALLTTVSLGLAGWPCPLLHFTGVPCPACGLTRATSLLIHGHVGQALRFHAFSPIVVLGLMIVTATAVLPEETRCDWLNKIDYLERKTGLVFILIAALIIYWLARVLFLQQLFVQLIRS